MYKNKYQIENAIIDGARVAYLATSLEKGNMNIERYTLDKSHKQWIVIKNGSCIFRMKLNSHIPTT